MIENEQYMISGSSFRLLVSDLYSLFTQYISISRRLVGARNEKDFRRLQKAAAGYERTARRLCRRWGIPDGRESIACDTIEAAIMEKDLTPLIPADGDEAAAAVCLDVLEKLVAKSKSVTADMEAALAELSAELDPFPDGFDDE